MSNFDTAFERMVHVSSTAEMHMVDAAECIDLLYSANDSQLVGMTEGGRQMLQDHPALVGAMASIEHAEEFRLDVINVMTELVSEARRAANALTEIAASLKKG